jgi:hypothetical protein
VSEELENSLRQAIESYLDKRLGAIDEQLSRLQSDFDEALKSLRESSASESLASSPLSAAIFAHLQTARSQKLSGALPHGDQRNALGTLKRAVQEIERQQTHADILGSLLTGAAQFAERAALFVIRSEQAIGWRECKAGDPNKLELIGGVSLLLSADTPLGRAARAGSVWSGAPGSNSADRLLIDQLGGDPQTIAAVPLVVRGKTVAVLYADSVSHDRNTVNVDALELLSRVAAMAVNLVSTPGAAPDKQPEKPETVAPPTVTSADVAGSEEMKPAESSPQEPAPIYTPQIEPQTANLVAEPAVEIVSGERTAEDGHPAAEPAVSDVSAEPATGYIPGRVPEYVPPPLPDYVPRENVAGAVEEVSAEPTAPHVPEYVPQSLPDYVPDEKASTVEEKVEALPNPPAASPAIERTPPAAIAPTFTSSYAAPLGSARRYGISEPDLPIEVGEEERRLHNDARRFARLLVSEIKLYNEPKVKEGRSRSDIYDRLREDIDRSRQMYDKRVAPPVAARHDYFHQELVNTLGECDAAKLGESYPGAILAAP